VIVNKTLLSVSRAVHVYLTMLGLLVMLLFAITGFTINHEDWFGALIPRRVEHRGEVPLALLAPQEDLRLVEHLRKAFGVRGAMTSFTGFPEEVAVAFKEPGQTWEFSIDRGTGRVMAQNERYNFTAIINNLHRGRFTGPAWRWVIDFSALLIVLACATGFVLWLALPRRRQLGIAFLALGTVGTMAVIYFLVPGPDIERAPPGAPKRASVEQRGR
jgi:uncharacterized protein